MISGWALALLANVAIVPNETVTVELLGGETVEGRVATIESHGLQLTTEKGLVWIESTLVAQANFEDRQLTQAALREEIRERLSYELQRIDGRYAATPRPLAAATASVVLPGAGQAMLGQNKEAKGFLVADVIVLSLGAYMWFVQKDRAAAVPLFALDLIFRSSSASQAYRLSQRRRALRDAAGMISPSISQ